VQAGDVEGNRSAKTRRDELSVGRGVGWMRYLHDFLIATQCGSNGKLSF
jgi:hypothetical protein